MIYYVSPTGNDTTGNGSSATPWRTVTKAFNTIVPGAGDILTIREGVYREQLAITSTPSSEFKIVGTGQVRITGFDVSDTAAPTGINTTLTLNGNSNFTFENLIFVGSKNATASIVNGTNSTNIKFTNCVFLGGAFNGPHIHYSCNANTNASWTFDRCRFFFAGSNYGFGLSLPTHTSDYNINFLVTNSLLVHTSGYILNIDSTGISTGKGGGFIFNGCSLFATNIIRINNTRLSSTYPAKINNSIISGALIAVTTGQIIENNNYINFISRTNVTAGANNHDFTTTYFSVDIGQSELIGAGPVAFLTPSSDSTFLSLASSAPSVDGLNNTRGSAIGYVTNYSPAKSFAF